MGAKLVALGAGPLKANYFRFEKCFEQKEG
jgi:hypothetical protein